MRELVGVGIVVELVERSTKALAHAGESLVRPAGDISDLLGGRRRQGVEVQQASVIADVHTIERERVELDVQPERRVAALHEGDRTDLRVVDRAQPQLELGSAPK